MGGEGGGGGSFKLFSFFSRLMLSVGTYFDYLCYILLFRVSEITLWAGERGAERCVWVCVWGGGWRGVRGAGG